MPDTASDSPERKLVVMLVDDEPNILQSLQRLLRREPFRVVTATSGEEALKLLAGLEDVALILSDQRMPNMNGAEFLERSREIVPDAIRMLLTGYSELGDAVNAINRGGISRYISKPWEDGDLVQALRTAVETFSLASENRRLQLIVSSQNEELKDWNRNLKERVLQQTASLRMKNDELHEAMKHQKESYQGMITSLVSLVEMRGTRNRKHALNVSRLSLLVARDMGLSAVEQETINTAALLHDIGEIGIPERILLLSPESLGPDDFREYSHHPVRGQLIVDPFEELRPAGVLVRHHHEKYDGSGFPDGLAAEDIPLGARIISYADLLDRAARQCSEPVAENALQRMDIHVGKSVDPHLRGLFHKFAQYVYSPEPVHNVTVDSGEREMRLDTLDSGMSLARSVYSGSGILLLQAGIRLDSRHIASLQRFHELDPSSEPIYILKPGRTSAGVMV